MSLVTSSESMAKVSCSELAERISKDAEMIAAGRLVRKRHANVLGLLLRDLSREEIALLEHRGCHADDWTQVRVAEDFNAFRVRRTYFKGSCVLGRFDAEVEVLPGMPLSTGIYDCTLADCQIGNNCLLDKVRFAAKTIVEHGAVLFDVGSVMSSGESNYGCGQTLPVAIESGGRDVPVWAEMQVDDAACIARDRGDEAGQEAIRYAVEAYVAALPRPFSWVRRGAVVRHTEQIRDVYIGSGAHIDHVLELTNVCVLSSPEESTTLSGGAALRDAVVQWGATVTGHAIVRNSIMLEHSGVDENGVVTGSVIGPNTTIAKGEVTASLVGPFVGFHHQSLLIAAYWPEGRGNIAYGAMVGSNHTGRAPDQEIWPGEGTFFGLGCSIRFPSDFSQAPYSVISAGVSTLAQKISLPFSLITQPVEALSADGHAIPRAYNELMPGWCLYGSAYGLERMEMKLAKRDKAKRHDFHYHVLRPSIITLVRAALASLESVSGQDEYILEKQVPGTGKNFIRRAALRQGIDAYRRVLKRYSLRTILGEAEDAITIPGSAEIAHDILDELMPGTDLAERLQELIQIETLNADIVLQSKAADDERGGRIIPGYAEAHMSADQDPVVHHARERVVRTQERVAVVLGK